MAVALVPSVGTNGWEGEKAPGAWLPGVRDCAGEQALPFQVVQEEEEGEQVGFWEGPQQVEHAALLCDRV